MIVKAKLSAVRETKWHEYALRFVLGGLATVRTGVIAQQYGPITGGLFLAFPAIFCASATLVEKHERKRKEKVGLCGARRGQEAAALESAGAELGSVGLVAFGAVCWGLLPLVGAAWAFCSAGAAWMIVSSFLWWARRFIRRQP